MTNRISTTSGFFDELAPIDTTLNTFDEKFYRPAPNDWALAVTDIVGSTKAIADGRHKTVNFVAAMGIAALKNCCAPHSIPFLFGGDGAVVMVPPERVAKGRIALARVRALAAEEFGLQLRVGMISVGELKGFGGELLVARYEPSPGNHFGVFLGGGVALLETAIRGEGDADLMARATIGQYRDDAEPIDLTGLSCRWDELRSSRGKMLTLIIRCAEDQMQIYADILQILAPDSHAKPVSQDSLRTRWPPPDFMLEARARRAGGLLAFSALRVLSETLLARFVFALNKPIGQFDPHRYRQEMITNTDFCKHDDTINFVVDCTPQQVHAIRRHLRLLATRQDLLYGIHESDSALMTCLVTSASGGQHVHFVDGGGGGYTTAAKTMKAATRDR